MNLRKIEISDQDIEASHAWWYEPNGSIWIGQKERGSERSTTHIFNKDEARQLRDILTEFLSAEGR